MFLKYFYWLLICFMSRKYIHEIQHWNVNPGSQSKSLPTLPPSHRSGLTGPSCHPQRYFSVFKYACEERHVFTHSVSQTCTLYSIIWLWYTLFKTYFFAEYDFDISPTLVRTSSFCVPTG